MCNEVIKSWRPVLKSYPFPHEGLNSIYLYSEGMPVNYYLLTKISVYSTLFT